MNINRSTLYYLSGKSNMDSDTIIVNEIVDIYQENPVYGYRRIQVLLRERGFNINHKKLQRLLSELGLKAIYPKKRTTIRDKQHKVYPYLLRDLQINRRNQVWQVDITYIKTEVGYVYLIALIDVYSRRIMGWHLSTFLEAKPCLEALKKALKVG